MGLHQLMEDGEVVTSTGPVVVEHQGGEPNWKLMDSAPTEPGDEIIAARFGIYDELTAMCEKSPFVSFWMRSRQKFYGEPTHWLCRVPTSFPSIAS
jgi:hypothetical protein